MTYDHWKTTNPDDAVPLPEVGSDELELVYCALHQALEAKCALIKAMQEIKAGLENLETTPGRRHMRWTTRCTKHDAWRVARDALTAAGVKS